METTISLHQLQAVRVKLMTDDDPDLSYLDQYEDSTDAEEMEYYEKDQARKNEYGDSWYCVGIRVDARIVVNGVCQTITSGGLWGIDSDSGSEHLTDTAREEAGDLLATLNTLNVDVTEFNALFENSLSKANL